MACKYKYNNNWYSKEELQSILYKERGIDKYGKVVKPEINKAKTDNVIKIDLNASAGANGSIHAQKDKDGNITLGASYWKKNEGTFFQSYPEYGIFNNFEDAHKKLKEVKKEIYNKIVNEQGIQPTQTNDTLKESIDSVKDSILKDSYKEIKGWGLVVNDKTINNKEYNSQALINTKIAALKEVAKKYPRSLIRSEVKPIFGAFVGNDFYAFDKDELAFQNVSDNSFQQFQQSSEPIINPSDALINKYLQAKEGTPLASNGKPSILYKSILDLPEVNGNKEMAYKMYLKTQSPAFKQWFGDPSIAKTIIESNFDSIVKKLNIEEKC